MPNTTDYEFGDVVLVPFPFTDQSASKKRPAVVASSGVYNRQRADIIVMAVTSRVRSSSYFGDVSVDDWHQAGLLKPSVIKPIFATIEKGLILRKLGHLSEKDRTALEEVMKTILGE